MEPKHAVIRLWDPKATPKQKNWWFSEYCFNEFTPILDSVCGETKKDEEQVKKSPDLQQTLL